MDIRKLQIVISALWLFLCLPIAQHLYEYLFDGFFLRIFSYLLVASPVWSFYGWRWLTNNLTIPKRLIALYLALCIAGMIFINEVREEEVLYIPILCGLVLLLLKFFEINIPKFSFPKFIKPKWLSVKVIIAPVILIFFVAFFWSLYVAEQDKREREEVSKNREEIIMRQAKLYLPHDSIDQSQSFEEIFYSLKMKNLTEVQRKQYVDAATGTLISDEGVISEVSVSKKTGKSYGSHFIPLCENYFDQFDPNSYCAANIYTVSISLDKASSNPYEIKKEYKSVSFDTVVQDAAKLSKGDRVSFSGYIQSLNDFSFSQSLTLNSVKFKKE